MSVAFWSAVGLLVYTYVGYPLLVLARGRLRPRPVARADVTPTVTVVIAAHNEAAAIGDRLENLRALDYPADRVEIVVASDGSEDATERIVASYADQGVHLLALPRVGKARAMNAAVAAASGEVLVFSDATTRFREDALRALLRPFADPSVGGVAGDMRYEGDEEDTPGSVGERRYWDLDRRLKAAQSRAGSVTSASGALYSLRRELYQPIPEGVTDDFHVSTAAIDAGYRLVFEPDACAYEEVTTSVADEFARKVRVITQGLRAVGVRRRLLRPRAGFYALQLFSHKVLRRTMVLPLLVLAAAAPLLWSQGPIYQAATVLQGGVYLGALVGWLWPPQRGVLAKALSVPTYFVMVNAACLVALSKIARGHRVARWEPRRGHTTA
jgi:cellulose synthase/poly-beta-1,6-N-acetylglucosamine synthase-like glycosyltransferase